MNIANLKAHKKTEKEIIGKMCLKKNANFKHIFRNICIAPITMYDLMKNYYTPECECDNGKCTQNCACTKDGCICATNLVECHHCQSDLYQIIWAELFTQPNSSPQKRILWNMSARKMVKTKKISASNYINNNVYMVETTSTYNGKPIDIDAFRCGNHSRFFNHSCKPNCQLQEWVADYQCRITIYSIKDILPDEELTFNYGPPNPYGMPCMCGSNNCQKFLPY